jgi:hypothetical protein
MPSEKSTERSRISPEIPSRTVETCLAGRDLLAWQQGKIDDPSRIEALAPG